MPDLDPDPLRVDCRFQLLLKRPRMIHREPEYIWAFLQRVAAMDEDAGWLLLLTEADMEFFGGVGGHA